MNPAELLTTIQQPKVIVALVLISAATGAAAASVTISQQDPNKVAAAQGTMNDSQVLSVADINMTYSGLDATGLTVQVANSDSVDHTGNVSIAVVDESTGTVIESTSKSNVNFAGNGTETPVDLTFSSNHRVDTFDRIDVNVEELS